MKKVIGLLMIAFMLGDITFDTEGMSKIRRAKERSRQQRIERLVFRERTMDAIANATRLTDLTHVPGVNPELAETLSTAERTMDAIANATRLTDLTHVPGMNPELAETLTVAEALHVTTDVDEITKPRAYRVLSSEVIKGVKKARNVEKTVSLVFDLTEVTRIPGLQRDVQTEIQEVDALRKAENFENLLALPVSKKLSPTFLAQMKGAEAARKCSDVFEFIKLPQIQEIASPSVRRQLAGILKLPEAKEVLSNLRREIEILRAPIEHLISEARDAGQMEKVDALSRLGCAIEKMVTNRAVDCPIQGSEIWGAIFDIHGSSPNGNMPLGKIFNWRDSARNRSFGKTFDIVSKLLPKGFEKKKRAEIVDDIIALCDRDEFPEVANVPRSECLLSLFMAVAEIAHKGTVGLHSLADSYSMRHSFSCQDDTGLGFTPKVLDALEKIMRKL